MAHAHSARENSYDATNVGHVTSVKMRAFLI